jgi:hypothetical protein
VGVLVAPDGALEWLQPHIATSAAAASHRLIDEFRIISPLSEVGIRLKAGHPPSIVVRAGDYLNAGAAPELRVPRFAQATEGKLGFRIV